MAFPTFASGDVLNASDMNAVGLWKITSVSLNAVTNNISNVFSSTYDSYRVVISDLNSATSTTRLVTLRFRTTSDDTGANYFWSAYGFYGTTAFNGGASGSTYSEIISLADSTNDGAAVAFDVHNPNLAKATVFSGHSIGYQSNVTNHASRLIAGGVNTSTQYTGFSIIGTTDALSGTVRVYGYRN